MFFNQFRQPNYANFGIPSQTEPGKIGSSADRDMHYKAHSTNKGAAPSFKCNACGKSPLMKSNASRASRPLPVRNVAAGRCASACIGGYRRRTLKSHPACAGARCAAESPACSLCAPPAPSSFAPPWMRICRRARSFGFSAHPPAARPIRPCAALRCPPRADRFGRPQWRAMPSARRSCSAMPSMWALCACVCAASRIRASMGFSAAGRQSPYFLTAKHCIADQESAASLEATWHHQSARCGSHHAYATRGNTTCCGATLLRTSDAQDASFLLLRDEPPVGVRHAGWHTGILRIREPVFTLSHPAAHGRSTRRAK